MFLRGFFVAIFRLRLKKAGFGKGLSGMLKERFGKEGARTHHFVLAGLNIVK
jgi:hypothetical protein